MPKDADNFYTSDKVTLQKVTFKNQYDMNIAGNLFMPKDFDGKKKLPAIVVGHPMGAVKEQSANLYATKMAEKGFVTLAIDLPFWGESGGTPRNSVSPDMYAEAFSAAADYLGTRPFVDPDGIGVIGICGSGSFAISAAKIDPRLKAVATVSMYDMGSASRHGLNKSLSLWNREKRLSPKPPNSGTPNLRAAKENIPAEPSMKSMKTRRRSNGNSLSSTARPEVSSHRQARLPNRRPIRR